jgi:hypothetical protein
MTPRRLPAVFSALLLSLAAVTAWTDSVWIIWDSDSNTNVAGYIAYAQTATVTNRATTGTNTITVTNRLTGQVFTGPGVLFTNVAPGVLYSYYALATNSDGLLSVPSDILLATIPLPPENARLVKP